MRTNEDPRAVRTRRLLDEALSRFMDAFPEGGLPSVVELTQEAGVARSAFYSHFSSVEDLALARVSSAFERIGENDLGMRRSTPQESHAAAEIAVRQLVRIFLDDRSLYTALLSAGSTTTYDAVIAELAARTRVSLASGVRIPAGVDRYLASEYIAGGLVRVLGLTAKGTTAIDESELIEQLLSLAPLWFVEGVSEA
jgi:AcrR family transcriptional regulator